MKKTERIAIFRLSVLGPLVSRQHIERGELKKIIRDIASRDYAIPYTDKTRIAEKTIEGWYYTYLKENLDGLADFNRRYIVSAWSGTLSRHFTINTYHGFHCPQRMLGSAKAKDKKRGVPFSDHSSA